MTFGRYREPVDALAYAVAAAFLSSGPKTPGYVVSHLPEAERALLRELTSDDARAMRPTLLGMEPRPRYR